MASTARTRRLHELLAVEGQLKGQATKTRNELAATFKGKRHLFERKMVTFHPKAEGETAKVEEQSDIQTSVPKELDWIAAIITPALDTSYRVAVGNTGAKADIVMEDGTILFSGVPATALLELEKRLGELQELLDSVPTLDPAKGFVEAPNEGAHIYVAREITKTRTQKVQEPLVLQPATDKHPAQVQLISVDKPIGTVTEQAWSAMITPAEKADLITRNEQLRRVVKQARMRANDFPVDESTTSIGKALFDYVLGKK